MRLIDADKLEMKILYDDSWDLEYPTEGVFDRDIREAPTVEAIPIEWILNHPKFPHNNEDRKKCILDMIADWEKENE